MAQTYLVRFKGVESRKEFLAVVESDEALVGLDFQSGTILPDVIVHGVEDEVLDHLKDIAETGTKFIPDHDHDLFSQQLSTEGT